MRRFLLAAVIPVACAAPSHAQPPASRIDILERWLVAVAQHEPGTPDGALEVVASWSIRQLRTLWVDVSSLVTLMRHPHTVVFWIETPGRRRRDIITYSRSEFARLRAMARAARGALDRDDVVRPELRALSGRVSAANLHADAGYVLKRGALLHADAAMSAPFMVETPDDRPDRTPAPRPMKFLLQDGRSVQMGHGTVHWEIARLLLDKGLPVPALDPMVRDFYHATLAYLQRDDKYEVGHLEHARELFPDDATVAFLSGCQHEAYASPRVQSVARTVTLPYGVSLGVDPPAVELRRAARFFRRALELDRAFDEARIRLGRVLGLLERHAEAATELQRATQSVSDPLLRYYAELFLGAEHEALGQFDAARAAYGRAAGLSDRAQAPHVALSHLARRTGDRAAALRALGEAFEAGRRSGGPDDPWWTYPSVAGRNASDLLERLWRPFRSEQSDQD